MSTIVKYTIFPILCVTVIAGCQVAPKNTASGKVLSAQVDEAIAEMKAEEETQKYRDALNKYAGIINIGPFGCMPNRLSEAILNETMKRNDKLSNDPDNQLLRSTLMEIDNLPFLAIESDGSPFPQLIHAKLEAFCLRARRLHEQMLANRYAN